MTAPTLVYDDDCGFCTWAADLVARNASVRLVGFSDLSDGMRERLPDEYESCAHFVTAETTYSCGRAVEEAFVRSDLGAAARPVIKFARNFEDYRRVREQGYRFVADNRSTFGAVFSKSEISSDDDE